MLIWLFCRFHQFFGGVIVHWCITLWQMIYCWILCFGDRRFWWWCEMGYQYQFRCSSIWLVSYTVMAGEPSSFRMKILPFLTQIYFTFLSLRRSRAFFYRSFEAVVSCSEIYIIFFTSRDCVSFAISVSFSCWCWLSEFFFVHPFFHLKPLFQYFDIKKYLPAFLQDRITLVFVCKPNNYWLWQTRLVWSSSFPVDWHDLLFCIFHVQDGLYLFRYVQRFFMWEFRYIAYLDVVIERMLVD